MKHAPVFICIRSRLKLLKIYEKNRKEWKHSPGKLKEKHWKNGWTWQPVKLGLILKNQMVLYIPKKKSSDQYNHCIL